MANDLTKRNGLPLTDGITAALVEGDLGRLTNTERATYYLRVCEAVGVDPALQPFSLLRLNGKLVMYANKSCAEQLRKNNGVSITELTSHKENDIYIVLAKALDKTGRVDASTGAVNIKGLSGDALANALMKTETKAKRRVTLSISGLGMMDESELETVPNALRVNVDVKTGEIHEQGEVAAAAAASINPDADGTQVVQPRRRGRPPKSADNPTQPPTQPPTTTDIQADNHVDWPPDEEPQPDQTSQQLADSLRQAAIPKFMRMNGLELSNRANWSDKQRVALRASIQNVCKRAGMTTHYEQLSEVPDADMSAFTEALEHIFTDYMLVNESEAANAV
jgi:hypothetical protein